MKSVEQHIKKEYLPFTVDLSSKCVSKVRLTVSKGSLTYKNFITMVDFNIDVGTIGDEFDKLDKFCNVFT